jgi:para-nitrobenzyl esterase
VSPVVTTAAGQVLGEDLGGCLRFLGIPYAVARRFGAPTAVPGWSGVHEATDPGPMPHQHSSPLDRFLGTAGWPRSEDCLRLHVWTPALDGARRPVLVWIHGGAFVTGTAAASWYHGESFARRHDCVLVSVGYRLGVLGFTHLADVAGEQFAGSGNLGLLDQIAALGWVREHVAELGGDPGNVTVFGESAGGASALALCTAPSATGLFRRSVAMSPSITQLRSRERASEAAEAVLRALDLSAREAHHLLDVPVDALLEAQRAATAAGGTANAFTAFAPTPDGTVLPEPVVPALASGRAGTGIDLVLGATRDELHLFTAFDPRSAALTRAGLLQRVAEIAGDRAAELVAAYEVARPGTPGQVASSIGSDHGFRLPVVRLARARAALGAPTWRYHFAWASPAWGGVLGACHGLDIPFAFHTLEAPGVALFTGDGTDREAVADTLHGALASFARSGDPGWPAYGATEPTLVVDTESSVVHGHEAGLLAHWDGIG